MSVTRVCDFFTRVTYGSIRRFLMCNIHVRIPYTRDICTHFSHVRRILLYLYYIQGSKVHNFDDEMLNWQICKILHLGELNAVEPYIKSRGLSHLIRYSNKRTRINKVTLHTLMTII